MTHRKILFKQMSKTLIKNLDDLIKYPYRQEALSIVEAGMNAIGTDKIITSAISIEEESLQIEDLKIDLSKFKRIRVIGFGKASCEAAISLEKILGSRIKDGVVIDIKKTECEFITSLIGTHPRSSLQNVSATKQILDLIKDTNDNDLVLVIVSGGGSALLCSTEDERAQGEKLYNEFIKVGGNIGELNTVRKHLSSLKGGGLAKILYPATVVGLIFCDIPEGYCEETASGPTYKDGTTVEDAQAILDKYGFKGFELSETPKEDVYFEKVHNINLVSSIDALTAMSEKAKSLGFEVKILSTSIHDTPEETVNNFKSLSTSRSIVMGGGEVRLAVERNSGSGGRCTYLALEAVPHLKDNDIFIAVASDGIDNSEAAGAIVDKNTLNKIKELKLDPQDYLFRYNTYNFFKKTDDLIITGQTGSNVSDLMLWIKQ